MGNVKKLFGIDMTKLHASMLAVAFLIALLMLCIPQVNAQSSQIQGARDNTQVYSGVVYGPIDAGDTLWQIASRYKKDERFTVYQTMLAIYELNPQAFDNGNFNTMVNGATLQLPSDRFIARIDPVRARAKADADERAMGIGTTPTGGELTTDATRSSSDNLKPEVALVNQDDLSKTSSELQTQLNGLRDQQQQQFLQLKNQVAASINSVQSLLEENKKLGDKLLQIDENNRNLTQKVEVELQTQIDQQVAQLNELITLVKDAEQRRVERESESILNILSSPIALVIIMSVVTLLVIVGLAIFLLRKPAGQAQPQPQTSEIPSVSKDIVDDELVIGEVNGELDQDSEDLMAALSDDDKVDDDDILSDALEDDDLVNALTDAEMDSELESIDDMLVPDSPTEASDIQVGKNKDNEDFDLDNDAISLDDEEGITLDDDSLLDLSDLDDELELDSEENASSVSKPTIPSVAKANAVREEDDSSGLPTGIDLDENGEIDENTIGQIENQIANKDETINRMADEILNELDNGPDGIANSDQKDEQVGSSSEVAQSSPEASDIGADESASSDSAEELNAILDSMGDDDALDKLLDLDMGLENDQVSTLADELLNELESESDESDELDNLLSEFEDTNDDLDDDITDVTDFIAHTKSQTTSTQERASSTIRDTDDLLDDIPSFTLDGSGDEDDDLDKLDMGFIDNDAAPKDELNLKDSSEQEDDTLDDLLEDSDDDVLAGLQGLDNWLDEEDSIKAPADEKNDDTDLSALALDDEIMKGLDDANFEDMLNDLAIKDDDKASPKPVAKEKDTLKDAGLDLEALMTDTSESETKDTNGFDFLDVDDLLDESEAAAKVSDVDIELNLDDALDQDIPNHHRIVADAASDVESDQASNLDLALVYLDMEDFDAAKELLDEVVRLGSNEQQEEASELLGKIAP